MKIYTVEDLIPILQVSRKAVRRYLARGKLRGRKVGKKWLVTEEALRRFLESPDISLKPISSYSFPGAQTPWGVTEHLKAATKEHLKTGHSDSGKSVSNRSPQRIKTIEIQTSRACGKCGKAEGFSKSLWKSAHFSGFP